MYQSLGSWIRDEFETLNSTKVSFFVSRWRLGKKTTIFFCVFFLLQKMLSTFIENSTTSGSKEHVLEFPNTIWMLLIHLAISTALSLIWRHFGGFGFFVGILYARFFGLLDYIYPPRPRVVGPLSSGRFMTFLGGH